MKIFLLNGPPRSGKDTLAEHVCETLNGVVGGTATIEKFAAPLKRSTAAFFDLDRSYLDEKKDTILPELLGKTPRQVDISKSEDWAKKFFGEKVFGRIMVSTLERRYQEGYRVAMISDSGFAVEAIPVVEVFRQNVTLVRLHREGCTFEGDSRSYLSGNAIGVQSHDIENNGSIEDLYHSFLNICA